MGKSFNLKYEQVVWENDEEVFEKWKQGKTGFPFIDACMRQLKHIGYMHNRGRMCVAMFLTKDRVSTCVSFFPSSSTDLIPLRFYFSTTARLR
jgi:deoxyribodipyrimidine photolyase